MPRRARLAVANVAWHIIQRGNNRSACFYADEDYQRYLATLKEQADKHDCRVHAYVLMTNHVHLLVTPTRTDAVAMMMKNLGQCYVQYINRTYRRSGTLWEGRFKSCLAQSEGYVLACYRYIELNPVRANMVASPSSYPWSSHRTNAYDEQGFLLSGHSEYQRLGGDEEERRRCYRELFGAHLSLELVDQIRERTNGNYVLGESRFVSEVEIMLARRATRGRSGRPTKKH